MKLDPHIHSCYSGDARSSPKDIVKKAKSIGLDMIAISDHDSVKGSKIAIELSQDMDDFLVIPSIEISSNKGHIIGFGVKTAIPKDFSPEETVEMIHDEGGIAIIPHPFSFYRNGLLSNKTSIFFDDKKIIDKLIVFDEIPKKSSIEGIEVLNARHVFGYSNFKAKKLSEKYDLAKIGASDSHFLESIGNCYTEFSSLDSNPTVDDVIEAIKSKKTIAKGKRTSNYLIAKEVFNKKIRRIY